MAVYIPYYDDDRLEPKTFGVGCVRRIQIDFTDLFPEAPAGSTIEAFSALDVSKYGSASDELSVYRVGAVGDMVGSFVIAHRGQYSRVYTVKITVSIAGRPGYTDTFYQRINICG